MMPEPEPAFLDIDRLVRARRRCGSVAWVGWALASLLLFAAVIGRVPLLIAPGFLILASSFALTRASRPGAIAHAIAVVGTLAWLVPDFTKSAWGWLVPALACGLTLIGVVAAFDYRRLAPAPRTASNPSPRFSSVRAFFVSGRAVGPLLNLLLSALFSLPCTGPAVAFLSGFDLVGLLERWNPPSWALVAYIFLVAPSFSGAYYFGSRAKRLCGLRIAEIRALDPRRPVLLLRSFQDDLTPLAVNLPFTIWQPTDLYPRRWTLEETLTRFLRRYGPVIAIGRPGESVPPSGAAREYVANEVWRSRIREYIAESSLVCVVLGETEGLVYEYQALAELRGLGKTVLVCPPGDATERRNRWIAFWEAVQGQANGRLPAAAEDALAGTVSERGELRLVVCKSQSANAYRMALEYANVPTSPART